VWLATFVGTFLHHVIARVQGPCVLLSDSGTNCSGRDLLWIIFDVLALLIGIPLLLVIGGLFFAPISRESDSNDSPSSTLDNPTAAAIGLFLISLVVFVASVFVQTRDNSAPNVGLLVGSFMTTITAGVATWVLAGRRT
jgi:uncharacterized BrkB/YihY/UPF0761 family membrane protein